MTDLINQITINGETTTFLNYVNPAEGGFLTGYLDLTDFLTAAYGLSGGSWIKNGGVYAIKFPVPWETISSPLSLPNSAGEGSLTTGSRLTFWQGGTDYTARKYFNSTNGNGTVQAGFSYGGASGGGARWHYVFAVADRFSFTLVSFSNIGRTSVSDQVIAGWLKEGAYTGPLYPYNFYCFSDITTAYRPNLINATGTLQFTKGQNALNCQTPTAGANGTDLLATESTGNNNYIGKFRNLIRLPASAVLGKIYRNEGIDPDTGVIETDQKAYWMCVGTWGTDKIGMRVWTENII